MNDVNPFEISSTKFNDKKNKRKLVSLGIAGENNEPKLVSIGIAGEKTTHVPVVIILEPGLARTGNLETDDDYKTWGLRRIVLTTADTIPSPPKITDIDETRPNLNYDVKEDGYRKGIRYYAIKHDISGYKSPICMIVDNNRLLKKLVNNGAVSKRVVFLRIPEDPKKDLNSEAVPEDPNKDPKPEAVQSQLSKLGETDLRFECGELMSNKINESNGKWIKYHSAQREWKSVEGKSLKDRIIQDILLLDLSRFGWAPCWSTPKDQIQMADNDPRALYNDLKDLYDESEMKVSEMGVFKQSRPQWRCTAYMHSERFAKTRRHLMLRRAVRIDHKTLEADTGLDDDFKEWLKGNWKKDDAENNLSMERVRSEFAVEMNSYHCAEKNDTHALCISFTATAFRVKAAMKQFTAAIQQQFTDDAMKELWGINVVWYDPRFQFANVFRRFRLLAMKTVSVPAHETLKWPTVEWIDDQNRLTWYVKYRIAKASSKLELIANERLELRSTFIESAVAKPKRMTFGNKSIRNPPPDVIVQRGLTCGMASKAFDNTVVCMRARLRFSTKEDCDDALKVLVEDVHGNMMPKEAKNLVEAFKAFENTAKKDEFYKNNKDAVTKFVRTYSDKKARAGSEPEHEIFEGLVRGVLNRSIEVERSPAISESGEFTLQPLKSIKFRIEKVVRNIISDAMNKRGGIDGALRNSIESIEPDRIPATGDNYQLPICLKDELDDTQILVVFRIGVDRAVENSKTFLADKEIDNLLNELLRMCPRHRRPAEDVRMRFQNQFSTKKLKRKLDVDVWRIDWWIGKGDNVDIVDYNTAKQVTPILPYVFSKDQLLLSAGKPVINHASSYSSSVVNSIPQPDPFQECDTLKESMDRLSKDPRLSDIDDEAGKGLDVTMSQLYGIFAAKADDSFGIQHLASIGRVCRVAFDLLRVGPISDSGEPWSYIRETSSGGGSVAVVKDVLASRLAIDNGRETTRFYSDGKGLNGASVLPPLQNYRDDQLGSQVREGEDESQLLAYPEYATGIFRFLQYRISASSREINKIRNEVLRSSSVAETVEEFDLQAQVASKYICSDLNDAAAGIMESTFKEGGAMILAKFLYPLEFTQGRINPVDSMANADSDTKTTVAYEKEKWELVSQLYMSCATSNLKAVTLETQPPIPSGSQEYEAFNMTTADKEDDPFKRITADKEYDRFKRITVDMAKIAEGLRKSSGLFQHMKKAAKSLRNGGKSHHQNAPDIINKVLEDLEKLSDDFAHNHATFEDGLRSYADLASARVTNLADLKKRFVEAYKSVRKFKQTYDLGCNGMLVYMVNLFKDLTINTRLKRMLIEIITSINVAMESDEFNRPSRTLNYMFNADSKIATWMGKFEVYAIMSSRVHTNAVLGCATAAAPFRDLPNNINQHTKIIRDAIAFDTFGGFVNENGVQANFYCYLPTSADVVKEGLIAGRGGEDTCMPEDQRDTPLEENTRPRNSSRGGAQGGFGGDESDYDGNGGGGYDPGLENPGSDADDYDSQEEGYMGEEN